MARLYGEFYNFPILTYRVSPLIVLAALGVSAAAALFGARGAVVKAIRLPPAEAMRPEPPALFRETLVERLGLRRFISEPVRMILRHLERQPLRAGFSIVGIAFAGASLVLGSFSFDAVEALLDIQFSRAQRQDATATFMLPVSHRALYELQRLPGVTAVEPQRSVPVRIRNGHRDRQVALTGVSRDARLQLLVDAQGREVPMPEDGLAFSATLAEILGVGLGDIVQVEVLEGSRPVRRVAVTALVDELMGTSVYMDLEALHVLLREAGSLSSAVLEIDSSKTDQLFDQLKSTPAVAGVVLRTAILENIRGTIAKNLHIVTFFNILFASVIAFGVIYNNARISLSERSRDLASLRVLGFTRGEISFILLGELAVLTLLGIPAGMALGYGLAHWIVDVYANELFRIPLIITPRTYAVSALTVIVASVLSSLAVRRRLHRLDLIAVLKTRE